MAEHRERLRTQSLTKIILAVSWKTCRANYSQMFKLKEGTPNSVFKSCCNNRVSSKWDWSIFWKYLIATSLGNKKTLFHIQIFHIFKRSWLNFALKSVKLFPLLHKIGCRYGGGLKLGGNLGQLFLPLKNSHN